MLKTSEEQESEALIRENIKEVQFGQHFEGESLGLEKKKRGR